MKIFLNGNYSASPDAQLSAFDRGFLFGDGLFTTLRVENSAPLFLELHLARLRSSCRFLFIRFPEDLSFTEIIGSLLQENQLTDARVKIVITRGIDARNQVLNYPSQKPTVAVYAFPLSSSFAIAPLSLTVADTVRGMGPMYRHKTTCYLQNLWYKTDARNRGFDDCIMVDHRRLVCETTTANLFFVTEKRIITPPAELPLLPGIMRQLLLSHGSLGGYPITEEHLDVHDLERIDAGFATSAIVEICPIRGIDGQPLPVSLPEAFREEWSVLRRSL